MHGMKVLQSSKDGMNERHDEVALWKTNLSFQVEAEPAALMPFEPKGTGTCELHISQDAMRWARKTAAKPPKPRKGPPETGNSIKGHWCT